MAPQVGVEPTTNRLTADRSTTELLRSVQKKWTDTTTIQSYDTIAELNVSSQ